jgi:hypothetical protein
MSSTAIVTDDTTIISEDKKRFDWGAAIAGAIAATAVSFFLITLGAGVGLALSRVPPASTHGAATFLTMGAIYVFAAQAFGFTVGGYLVGRLIGPEVENSKEEEFRAAAHGLVMWAVAVVAGLLIAGFAGSALTAPAPQTAPGYWLDTLFRPAQNTPQIIADKAEVQRIWTMDIPAAGAPSADDSERIARLVSVDTGLSMQAAMERTVDVQDRMRQSADQARKAAAIFSLWTAFALLFGAMVAVAAAISARWMDDRITFSMAPRR